ncbi:tyrosine recombinase XerD [Thermincola ferriacetica]|uniref:Tyrosine recombinase XerD n=1 Tax=Thermincola ferriacetica TaxID=281456 RepID=A0A0L6W1P3_9FIRM|nr:tyrosine-type recombinase/integrase [Thermincola ferriacetica]KNZ69318.1 tyrosine recombinase XerD [Thermincola ferriacetica]
MAKRRKRFLQTKDVPAANLSFDEAVHMFLDELKIRNRSKRTIEWHRENFHAVRKVFREQKVQLSIPLATSTVKKHLVLYCKEQLNQQPRTINMRLGSLKMLHSYLVKEGYLDVNPLADIDSLKLPKNIPVSLTDEQIERLLRVPDRKTFTGLRDFTIMLLLLETGIRVSELANIKLKDINLKDGYIKIFGKGAKERNVPIQSKFKKVLSEYLLHRGDLDTDALFVTVDNTPLKVRSIQERIEIIAEKAGITEIRTSPHIWRHTFARKYIVNGGDVFSLKQILGHSGWQMVHHYVNLFSSDVFKKHQQFSPVQNLRLPSV